MKIVSMVSFIATSSFFFLLVLSFTGFSTSAEADGSSVLISKSVVVSPDGRGNFKSINEAVAAAPNNSDGRKSFFLITIKEGTYAEYVSINKPYIMMVGQGINRTIITGNRNYVDGLGIDKSPTFTVLAQGLGFVAVNITFQNTAGPSKLQAVALRNAADMLAFYRCSFEGYQDTLYLDSHRQFYRECDIYGTIDFIFGDARAVLQNCNIYPRLPSLGQFNVIVAQGRTSLDPIKGDGLACISIHNCAIKPAHDLASNIGSVKTYLGRPWKEYSRTVVMQSFLDTLIDPAGWSVKNGTDFLSTLYFAEYNNKGPGANTSKRVTWLGYHVINNTDAAKFTVANLLEGNAWLPQTGVPYILGLI